MRRVTSVTTTSVPRRGIVDRNTLVLLVAGYPTRQSVLPGDEVVFCCSSRVPRFSVTVARIGATREVVWQRDGIGGTAQPVPADAWATGCGWSPTFTVPVADGWRSGFYEVTFRADGVDPAERPEAESHACFVVRSTRPGADAPIVLALATNTYNAYNTWGGKCLYTGATQVSFQRPIERGYVTRHADPDGYEGRVASIEPNGDPDHRRLLDYLETGQYPMW